MEVLVERHVVAPERISLELLVRPEHWPPFIGATQEDRREPPRDVVGDFGERRLAPRTGRVFDPKVRAEEPCEPAQRFDDVVVDRHPDRAAPVGVAAEQVRRRLAGFVVDARLQAVDVEDERRGAVACRQRAQAIRRKEL